MNICIQDWSLNLLIIALFYVELLGRQNECIILEHLIYIKIIFLKTGSVINSTFSRNKKCNASEQCIIDDKELKDPTVIANEFNKYFVNIGQSLAEKITQTHDFNFYLKNRIDGQLRFTLVDEEHIVGIFID